MKEHVEKLTSISKKETRKIIGLMSGTSLDGLDIALCSITGSGKETKIILENFETVEYDQDLKKEVKTIFSKTTIELEKLCLLNEWLGIRHASMINTTIRKWEVSPTEIDLIASHGQTIYHAPVSFHKNNKFGNSTLQIGDGDHISVYTGIITISDFRQKHIASGGEGAPLAAYGDMILFGNNSKDVILLNIGGISNFTFLPASEENKMFSTDIGPGNTLMDAWMQQNFGQDYDKDAAIAREGNVNIKLLHTLKDHTFFKIGFPKSTGPELFNLHYLENAFKKSGGLITPQDVMATLNAFTASVICDAINKVKDPNSNTEVLLSGGGMHNPLVIEYLRQNLGELNILSTAVTNIDPDAKEAILFAILANECVAGNEETFKLHFPNISMGKISFPS